MKQNLLVVGGLSWPKIIAVSIVFWGYRLIRVIELTVDYVSYSAERSYVMSASMKSSATQ